MVRNGAALAAAAWVAACFFPGEFVRNTGPGDRMTFVYLQTTFRF